MARDSQMYLYIISFRQYGLHFEYSSRHFIIRVDALVFTFNYSSCPLYCRIVVYGEDEIKHAAKTFAHMSVEERVNTFEIK